MKSENGVTTGAKETATARCVAGEDRRTGCSRVCSRSERLIASSEAGGGPAATEASVVDCRPYRWMTGGTWVGERWVLTLMCSRTSCHNSCFRKVSVAFLLSSDFTEWEL